MQTYKVKIYLQDECPRIGSGWRCVTAKLGRKWVHLQDHKGCTGRIGLEDFELFKPLLIGGVRRVKRNGASNANL